MLFEDKGHSAEMSKAGTEEGQLCLSTEGLLVLISCCVV